jgi:steroid delta-isomerase-like uncharacterized protein
LSEETKAVVRRYFEEGWNKGNLATIDELVSPGCVWHKPDREQAVGPQAVKDAIERYRRAFPDLHCTIDGQLADGDTVVTRWSVEGTQAGELMGISPTGNRVDCAGIVIHRFVGGKIVEAWDSWDKLGFIQQLGVVPAVQEATAYSPRTRR